MKVINKSLEDKVQDFKTLLDTLTSLTDKKKQLWFEIYRNALLDRDVSFNMYTSVSALVLANPIEHAIHGPNISKYIERMSRCNDQLLKLAELISHEEDKSAANEEVNIDDLYDKFDASDSLKKRKRA